MPQHSTVIHWFRRDLRLMDNTALHHAAKDGKLDLHLNLAPNDATGIWEIRAKELASGKETKAFFRVTD